MKTVYKFAIDPYNETTIMLPPSAVVIAAKEQFGQLYIWVLLDTQEFIRLPRKLFVIGTGQPINYQLFTYIDTVMMNGGGLVWHVFEEFQGSAT